MNNLRLTALCVALAPFALAAGWGTGYMLQPGQAAYSPTPGAYSAPAATSPAPPDAENRAADTGPNLGDPMTKTTTAPTDAPEPPDATPLSAEVQPVVQEDPALEQPVVQEPVVEEAPVEEAPVDEGPVEEDPVDEEPQTVDPIQCPGDPACPTYVDEHGNNPETLNPGGV